MRYIEDERRFVWSASDLKAAADCEFAWVRRLDAKLGRVAEVADPVDETTERAARLGTEHEHRVLQRYLAEWGDRVVVVPEARASDSAALADAVALTTAALADPRVEVIFQAAFSAPDFVGFADFLVRDDGRRWVVQDTKLARRARVTALMQLAAYADRLDAAGAPRSDRVELLLGDGSTSVHRADDLLPVFRLRRARLLALIDDRDVAAGAASDPIAWGDARGDLQVFACGRCATCDIEVVAHRDLLLVAGMRPTQRERLRAAGVASIDDLAAAAVVPERMSSDAFAGLRAQAQVQLESAAGVGEPSAPGAPVPVPSYRVVLPAALRALPRPDHGDLFFDFEGDPLHSEAGSNGWGLDYLFGWTDERERYHALWAHDFAEERRALERFVDMLRERRVRHPDLHVYHYAPYEPTHLLAMAARYGTREAEVDQLLRDGAFIDLYPIVRRALRVGSRSYSIKKLEPLYMGDEVRTSDVQRGDDSIVKYVEARAALERGESQIAEAILDDLADYNRYDCVSTMRLRDWLIARAIEAGLHPAPAPPPDGTSYRASPRADALRARAADLAPAAVGDDPPADEPSDDARALLLAAAAIDYYPRESKTFWASHFLRLREPLTVWDETRDVVVVDRERSAVIDDWHTPEGARAARRTVRLRGDLAPGTRLTTGARPFALYETPPPFPLERVSPQWMYVAREVRVVDVLDDGVEVEEYAVDGEVWDRLPSALTPASPPAAGNQQRAIDEWADELIAALPRHPQNAALDLLRRRPPHTRSGHLSDGTDDIDAITRTLLDLDRGYLAVQGPPGTGKTWVGSHVIARLVAEHGWRIGVVAQSHAVIEHMLDRIVAAGVPADRVAKAPKSDPTGEESFTVIAKNDLAAFLGSHPEGGVVVGGTAWDFSNDKRVGRRSLDALVIDEAGQFSLASTIAVSVASDRLLLLGDPQQLPQVSQGTHPEPVDTSALGWVMAGADTLPADRGFFLERTWRMHPAVAEPVSRLSYDARLRAHPSTADRSLAGVEPGVHPLPVIHRGDSTQSMAEAERVLELVRELVGRDWHDGHGPARPLTPGDLIVVTPYNAQQVLVEQVLAEAGFAEVPVGTVDRFQGQEAAVAILSLAASSGRDAPRGLEFLLLQNRLNVAVSRAQYAAFVVYSPGLLDDLPRTPDGVVRLSAFARLVAADRPTPAGVLEDTR